MLKGCQSSYTWGGHTQFYCGGSAIRDAAYGTVATSASVTSSGIRGNSPRPQTNTSEGTPRPRVQRLQRQQREHGAGRRLQDNPRLTVDCQNTYSEVANAQNKAAAVKEKVVDKVKDSKDIKDDE